MQSPQRATTQFSYGALNEPQPLTPTSRQQPLAHLTQQGSPHHQHHGYYALQHQPQQQHQQAQSPTATQPSMFPIPSPTSHVESESNIVGPSDHYGINHQQFATKLNSNSNLNGHYKLGSGLAATYTNGTATTNNNSTNVNNNNCMNNVMTNGSNHDTHHFQNGTNRQQIAATARAQEETNVCVIVDSRTPVIIKVPVAPTRITLHDLKKALPAVDQPFFKYFFKSNDSEFGIVKEEIQDNFSQLPTYRNRVVAWIVTPMNTGDELASKFKSETSDTCNLTYTNTTYNDGSSILTTDLETTSYFTETDDDSMSCSNLSETTCDTFISQRRNIRYNPKNNNNKSSSSTSSTSTPTSNSAYSEATAVQCVTAHLVLTNENFLGLHIYANAVDGVDEGIYVDEVTENSAVAQDGRIEPGDKLIQVNDVNLEELTNDEAVKVLKDAVIKRGPLKLVVAKFVETNKNERSTGLDREAIHPIDTAAWVAHAQAMTMPMTQQQDSDCIRQPSNGSVREESNDIKDIIAHMRMPTIGINIKDRTWLKIHIPSAFLGSDLIKWLERNVHGFDAKKLAARMLDEGYIEDPLSKKEFSPRSFYTFTV